MVRELDQELVREVWEALCAYDPERSQAEARAFVGRQPHLVALAERLMEEFDREVQKAAFGLLFLLTKVVEAHREASIPSLLRERVARAYATTLAWMERWEGADERFLARSGEFPQPHLIPYLLSTFYPGGGGPPEYEAEVKGSLFLLLQSAVTALEGPGGEGEADQEVEGR